MTRGHVAVDHGRHVFRGPTPGQCRAFAAAGLAEIAGRPLPAGIVDALADGTPIDRADGLAYDLSETEVLVAWRDGVALVVRS